MATNATLAKIHIAKKELALDDDTYRAMLREHGGVSSARDLTPLAAAKVLQHLEKAGFKPKTNFGTRPRPAPGRRALIGKIEAQLAEAKRPWAYAHAMAERMFKVEKVDWLREEQLSAIIAALAYDAKRRGAAKRCMEDTHGT